MFLVYISVFIFTFFFSFDLYAWGPLTHLKLGLSLVDNLKIVSSETSRIISANTNQFLYGCISADFIQAKKFLKYVLNCHNWENGFKLLRSAKSDELKSFSLGYLCHLAADIIAHNCFIPTKIVETYSKKGLKHFMWELRFDSILFDNQSKTMLGEITKGDHSLEDDMMNELLKTTFFSFKTNKRIFSGLLFIQRLKRWQMSIENVCRRKNYTLHQSEVDYYFDQSLNAMLGFLIDMKGSKFTSYDPTGIASLDMAKKMVKDLRRKEKSGGLLGLSHEVHKKIEHFKNYCTK